MKLIHLLRELQIGLQAETGDDQPILSIKVSHAVWHRFFAEVQKLSEYTRPSITATQFRLMGIEITK